MTLDARLAIAEDIISPHQMHGRLAIDAIREARQAFKDVLLPGWFCSCGIWTGSSKGATSCRACGKERTR